MAADGALLTLLEEARARTSKELPYDGPFLDCIQRAMADHPEFSLSEHWMFGWQDLQIGPAQHLNLAEYARKTSPREALAWYRRLLAKERAAVRCFALIGGVRINEPIDLGQRVSLCPVKCLPPGGWHRATLAEYVRRWEGPGEPNCVAWTTVEAKRTIGFVEQATHSTEQGREAVSEVADALALQRGASPLIVTEWLEFEEEDMLAATTSASWSVGRGDARTIGRHVELEATTVSLIEQYFRLPGGFQRKVRIALNRLALARRRRDAGNRAIELAIAAESLLGDPTSRTEMTHKVSARAAVMLGGTFDMRQQTFGTIRYLYKLRSAVVHGTTVSGTLADLQPAQEVIEQLLALAVRAGTDMDARRADLMAESNWRI